MTTVAGGGCDSSRVSAWAVAEKCCHGMYLPVIESLNNGYYSDGGSPARACAGEDGDEAVLLHRKGSWIEREGPICESHLQDLSHISSLLLEQKELKLLPWH
ncbi:hypothetical protein M5K25_021587 [Dendrobium thyrsiflorum]|uniref:Uncharacterized protein n=1 Tax=Dendrobium thyrsiflorum TaxID=117978 RepID=A0ABD0UCP3_DENTH